MIPPSDFTQRSTRFNDLHGPYPGTRSDSLANRGGDAPFDPADLAYTRFEMDEPVDARSAPPPRESMRESTAPSQHDRHQEKPSIDADKQPAPRQQAHHHPPTRSDFSDHPTRPGELSPDSARSPNHSQELKQIGPYDLIEVIGEGGMGVVYRAEDRYLKRPAAVKLMKKDIARDEERWQLFLSEARATAALRDDRIGILYQIGEEDGQFYLAMELLHGESLETRLRRGPIPLELATWIIRETLLGLRVAHETGFVHRDVKPANLWLETAPKQSTVRSSRSVGNKAMRQAPSDSDYLRVKILDFGLARLEGDGLRSKRGSAAGTPAYMAPEQATGNIVDARADLFSLGVASYRLLTGRLPFPGSTALEILTAMGTQAAPPITDLNPAVPPGLAAIVQRLLSCDPLGRPASAGEVLRQLDALQNHPNSQPSPRTGNPRVTLAAGITAIVVALGTWWLAAPTPTDTAKVEVVVPIGQVLSPQQAVHAIGERVTVDFTVNAIESRDEQVYLVASLPAEGAPVPPFRVVLPARLVEAMKRQGYDWPAALQGARLKLVGIVERDSGFGQILAGDMEQFESISYADGVNPKRASGQGAPSGNATVPRSPKGPSLDPLEARRIGEDLTEAIKELTRDIILPFGGFGGPSMPKSALPTLPPREQEEPKE